jgi:predicted RNA-binding Zn-ribbon protein involved in translation (DUF1610 family)
LLRRHVEEAADMVGHLRSIADPTKAVEYGRFTGGGSRPDIPAPVAADLIDSSNDIMRTLREWALHVQFPGQGWRAQGLEAGIDAASAYDDAAGCADVILDAFDRLVNTLEVQALADAFLTRHVQPVPWWSVADALARWPLDDRARWATTPCPGCEAKTVRVVPPRRRGMSARYKCTTCEWERSDRDDGGFWAEAFADARDLPAREIPLGDPKLTTAHDPRWLTLAASARLAKYTAATVKRWAAAGEIRVELGRYWRADVEAARDKRLEGEAA